MKPNNKISPKDLEVWQKFLGYTYKNTDLFIAAITHPSCLRHKPSQGRMRTHFQRLEFLGDRCLSAILARKLFELFPEEKEGFLSRAYVVLSQGRMLVQLACEIHVDCMLQRDVQKLTDAMLEDALEAIVGSIWLDSDYPKTEHCVLSWMGDLKQRVLSAFDQLNYKGQLQEFLGQKMHELTYEIVKISGPEHQRRFCAEVQLSGRVLAQGYGSSKQMAEEEAACLALKLLKGKRTNFSPFCDV